MGIAVGGMDFQDSLDNGGRSIKVVFKSAQSEKKIQRKLVCKNDVFY